VPVGAWARFYDLTGSGESFVLADPVTVIEARRPGEVLDALRAAELAASAGNWVAGFVTYEAAVGLDAHLSGPPWPSEHPMAGLPLVWFAAFRRRQETGPPSHPAAGGVPSWRIDRDEAWHRRSVRAIKEDIAAGRYYQLNLTARLTSRIEHPDELYARMSLAQRGAYNALIATGEFTVVSTSPELFFTRDGRRIVTRPMKGTARRGRSWAEDRARAAELRRSSKERAENVMIVDLLRNDLGRIAELGTVKVPALFAAERYPTLWQLTSTVEAQLRPEVDLADVFTALFPCGSVTGAPKRSAMSAITRLEQRPRGVYCGAVGHLAPGGNRPTARFSVAIRTATCNDSTGYAEYGSGGGITWSSRPDAEWTELRAKTVILREAPTPRTLFETLRFEPVAELVNLDRHLRRLEQSADYFGFAWSRREVFDALAAALDGRHDAARIRVTLDRSGSVRVDVMRLPAASGTVTLGIAETRVRSDDVLLFHKHGERAAYDTARAARPDVDDVILRNERGEITETTIANLAVRAGGRWWTPALECGLLPGVERDRLLATAVLAERVITLDELLRAEAVAVISSLRGWRDARVVDGSDVRATPRGQPVGRGSV
jgi:para-aminobenzoate synthetase/4-amino-4-deoxychorismate lyase